MSIFWSAWEQTQHNLVEDFLDLFLSPVYEVAVETDYPRSAVMRPIVENLSASIELPETKLLRLEQYWDEPTADMFGRRLSDWAVVLAFDLLEGFGHGPASNLRGAEFDGLKQLANVWGLRLAREFQRVFHRFEFFTSGLDLAADLILVLRQFPARDLGEMIRGAATPAYVRAGQMAAYQFALFNGDQAAMHESQSIFQASDAEIQRGIDWYFRGSSSEDIGTHVQRLTVKVVSALREVFSSDGLKQHYLDIWPVVTRQMSWAVGYRLRQNMEHDPTRTARLLEAVGRFTEITAVMEQYRYKYGWQGDRNKAVVLGWQAVGPKYFRLPGKVEDIREDDGQEKLIGMAQGLEGYTSKNRAIEALTDGFLGRLGAYLKRAAENEETDYQNKQKTDGNIVLTEAKHVEDFRSQDEDEDREVSDEEILSREKEKRRPSRYTVTEVVEAKEIMTAWYSTLTERQRTAVDLKVKLDNEGEIARRMGISQQRVSQLLGQALKKWHKFSP